MLRCDELHVVYRCLYNQIIKEIWENLNYRQSKKVESENLSSK